MRLSDFDYDLPRELIAQHPIHPRDTARLMVVDRASGRIDHRVFRDLPAYLAPTDVLVINDTRVIPARLHGRKRTGGAVEMLFLRPAPDGTSWEALVKPGRGTGPGTRITVGDDVQIDIAERRAGGIRVVRVLSEHPVMDVLQRYGEVPLPPYVHEHLAHPDDYQTVYAAHPGAVAAPTAGLHFTDGLIAGLQSAGVRVVRITMHLGLGTFRPVTVDDAAAHRMEAEWYAVTPEAADQINQASRAGGRAVVVGTSAVRTLETVAEPDGMVRSGSGWSDLFIYPGFRFAVTDMLVTNFHLPRTTLLMLVSAFAGHALVRQAYAEAIAHRYRFYSFGDAMLIL